MKSPRSKLALALLAGFTGGCGAGLPYATHGPPAILAETTAAGVRDLRGRFREIFCSIAKDHGAKLQNPRPCEDALVRFGKEPPATGRAVQLGNAAPRSPNVVIVPGIFGECVSRISLPFEDAAAHLRIHGYKVHILKVSGRSSSEHNAGQIERQLKALGLSGGDPLILIGYSKGTSDLIETLGRRRNAIPKGSALVSVAGVVAGTPIADRGEGAYRRLLSRLRLRSCRPGDKGGVQSLTRRERLLFLQQHPLTADYLYFSLPAVAKPGEVSRALLPTRRTLDRIDARNDGQVIHHDAIYPQGALLGYANADHWAVTLDFTERAPFWMRPFTNRNAYPRSTLLEAIVRSVEEEMVRTGG